MIKEYRGLAVLQYARLRLVPSNENYPDCTCDLLITDSSIFVVEDNYDNTYTEHCIIPLSRVSSIKIVTSSSDGKSDVGVSDRKAFVARILEWVLKAMAGIYVLTSNEEQVQNKYLQIDYMDERAKKDVVFFTELDGDAKAIVRYWEKRYL